MHTFRNGSKYAIRTRALSIAIAAFYQVLSYNAPQAIAREMRCDSNHPILFLKVVRETYIRVIHDLCTEQ